MERLEIVDLFAHTHQLYRNAQLIANGYDDTALCSTIQLCQHDAGNICHFLEQSRLVHGVLSGGCVQHQQNFPMASLCSRLNDAVDLCQFLHQILLIMQPSCGVADQHITARSWRHLISLHIVKNGHLRNPEFHDLHSSLCKRINLDRRWEFKESGNLPGCR